MHFGHRLVGITTVVLLVTVGAIVGMSIHNLALATRQQEAATLNSVSMLMRTTIQRTSDFALAEAEMLARRPDVVAAMAGSDRTALVSALLSLYAYMKSDLGVEIVQFQSPNLTTFARIQDPSRFGEDISLLRPIVLASFHAQRARSGIEFGPTRILALRGVAPIFSGKDFVGTAEVGMGVTQLLQTVKTSTGADVAVVLLVSANGKPQADKAVYGDVWVSEATDGALFGRLLSDSPLDLQGEDTQTERTLESAQYGIVASPLLDFSGKKIGAIVSAQNFSSLNRDVQRQIWGLLFVAFAGLVLAWSIVAIAMRAFVDRPLALLTDFAIRAAESNSILPPLHSGASETDLLIHAVRTLSERANPAPAGRKEPGT